MHFGNILEPKLLIYRDMFTMAWNYPNNKTLLHESTLFLTSKYKVSSQKSTGYNLQTHYSKVILMCRSEVQLQFT